MPRYASGGAAVKAATERAMRALLEARARALLEARAQLAIGAGRLTAGPEEWALSWERGEHPRFARAARTAEALDDRGLGITNARRIERVTFRPYPSKSPGCYAGSEWYELWEAWRKAAVGDGA